MSYQVLARKWRPHNFSEVVGQEHVVEALTNALVHSRMHHAYLFTGTRGVGKTTIARILAKALNCEQRSGADPCCQCPACLEIDQGRYVDLLEVDAASRTKVEDTRELLENVQYAPARGQYKVYLIDEVHMLSGHSFNALLKTLEEPPPHVKFLLATTDPQKIPVTVLSRCLQFNLKRMLPEQIAKQMVAILTAEQLDYDMEALMALARAADGSMRDGLSLLDQAIVHGGGRVSDQSVKAMLGTVARQPVIDLLRALTANDAPELLRRVAVLAESAPDFAGVLQQLLLLLHRIALLQAVPGIHGDSGDEEALIGLAAVMSPEDVQLYYQIALLGQRDLPLAPDPRSGFEMSLLRMLVFRPPQAGNERAEVGQSSPASEPEPAAAGEAAAAPESPCEMPKAEQDWLEIIKAAGIGGMARQLAHNCVLQRLDEQQCVLLLSPGCEQLRTQRVEEHLEKALQGYYRKPLKLIIQTGQSEEETPAVRLERSRAERQRAAELAIERDGNVQALKETFDGRVIPGSTEPVDDQ